MPEDAALFEKGMPIRREVLGAFKAAHDVLLKEGAVPSGDAKKDAAPSGTDAT